MHTGDSLTDSNGRTWTMGQRLGRGTWGTSWVVRDREGREMVLKVAHAAEDLPSDAAVPPELIATCHQLAHEQAALLRDAAYPFLPRLEALLDVNGRPALLLPRYGNSLEKRLAAGMPLGDALELLLDVTSRVETLAAGGRAHGNLKPSNVLVNERGEPVLADLLTPAGHGAWKRLAALGAETGDWRPPEAAAPVPGWDAWAICVALYGVAMQAPSGGEGRRDEPPRAGLDKVQIASLKDRALARLKHEGANPRFMNRVAERLASLLNRGICKETEPSPPYRFHAPKELKPRLAELSALVHPRVDHVGRVLLGPSAQGGVFLGGEPLAFSVTVGCTSDAVSHEDIACGVALHDLDAAGEPRVPIPETKYTVKPHPSGRLRFDFNVPNVPPGRYRAGVAFTVKDSGAPPELATGEMEVRPPPGYVPPAEEGPAGPVPLAFPGGRARTASPGDDEPAPFVPSVSADVFEEVDAYPTPIPPSPSLSDDQLPDAPQARTEAPPARLDAPRPQGAPVVSLANRGDAGPRPMPRGDRAQQPDGGVAVALAGRGDAGGAALRAVPSKRTGAMPVPVELEPGAAASEPSLDEPPAVLPSPLRPAPALRVAPSVARPTPTATVAQPSVTLAAPPAVRAPKAPPMPRAAGLSKAPLPRATASPGRWEELPGPEEPSVTDEPWLPGGAHDPTADASEDLPEWGDDPRPPRPSANAWLGRALDAARRDTYTTFLVGLGAVLFLALLMVSALKACI